MNKYFKNGTIKEIKFFIPKEFLLYRDFGIKDGDITPMLFNKAIKKEGIKWSFVFNEDEVPDIITIFPTKDSFDYFFTEVDYIFFKKIAEYVRDGSYISVVSTNLNSSYLDLFKTWKISFDNKEVKIKIFELPSPNNRFAQSFAQSFDKNWKNVEVSFSED